MQRRHCSSSLFLLITIFYSSNLNLALSLFLLTTVLFLTIQKQHLSLSLFLLITIFTIRRRHLLLSLLMQIYYFVTAGYQGRWRAGLPDQGNHRRRRRYPSHTQVPHWEEGRGRHTRTYQEYLKEEGRGRRTRTYQEYLKEKGRGRCTRTYQDYLKEEGRGRHIRCVLHFYSGYALFWTTTVYNTIKYFLDLQLFDELCFLV